MHRCDGSARWNVAEVNRAALDQGSLSADGWFCVYPGRFGLEHRLALIKNLWTSSFVMVTSGCSLLLLAWFYAIIDVMEFRRWAFFWVVIGVNAITIYMVQRFIKFDYMSAFFLTGIANTGEQVLPGLGKVCLVTGTVAAEWLFLWYLYKQRLFLRV